MGIDVPALRDSFELLAKREPELTRRFYELLFARHPQVAPMFHRRDRRAQEVMLRDALVLVLERLEDGQWMTVHLQALGSRHAGYGVTEQMYDWVGACLLETFGSVAGADWSERFAAAWTEAYGVIATLMKEGAARASAPEVAPEAVPAAVALA